MQYNICASNLEVFKLNASTFNKLWCYDKDYQTDYNSSINFLKLVGKGANWSNVEGVEPIPMNWQDQEILIWNLL